MYFIFSLPIHLLRLYRLIDHFGYCEECHSKRGCASVSGVVDLESFQNTPKLADLGHTVALVEVCWKASMLISKAVTSVYIPTSS